MEENQHIAVRKEKINTLREQGTNPFPNKFKPANKAKQLAEKHADDDKEALSSITDVVSIAGRIMFIRMFGKLAFFKVQDTSGQIQCEATINELGDEFETFKKLFEVGDIVGVTGTMTRTQKGELTLAATSIEMLNKTTRPLPEKWHGLSDVETRYRQRYVDLITNNEVMDIFKKRSQIITEVRSFLNKRDYMEVETPMLQHQAGGAAARPFSTHHNTLDCKLNLRIAPELYLKRLLVGGYERVYELARNFRNEGISTKHNPEFTMLEFYQAYATYEDMWEIVEGIIKHTATEVMGTTILPWKGHDIDVGKPFAKMTMREALLTLGGATEADLANEASIKAFATKNNIKPESWMNYGEIFGLAFEELCESKLIQPTFIYEYPVETSPLVRPIDDKPGWVDRSELYIGGQEMAEHYSELNDPEEQAARFKKQVEEAAEGNDEAMPYDTDFIRSLEFGMPPAGGVGIGIDRLVMLLTGQDSIRDVLLFPLLRPEQTQAKAEKEESAA